jgi:hypothetical protein
LDVLNPDTVSLNASPTYVVADTPLVGRVGSAGLHGRYGKIGNAVETADQLALRRGRVHYASSAIPTGKRKI